MKIKNKISAKMLSCALLSVALVYSSCKKEEDIIPDPAYSVSKSNESLTDSVEKFAAVSFTAPAGAYYIENALPSGYVKNGTEDYTSYLQSAINKYSVIVFPAFPIQVNDRGLIIPSNRKIYFTEGSELRLKPTSKSKYDVIKIDRVSNVTLIGPKVIGDRSRHIGTSGEWGNGIGIYSSSNISVESPFVYDCWGDGIYIGRRDPSVSKNVTIIGAYLRNNRRAGISITSADGLTLDRLYAGYTNGASPACGINFEPNSSEDQLKNINVIRPLTKFNEAHGIQIVPGSMYSSSNKEIDITITKHVDLGSYYAFRVSNSWKSGAGHLIGTIKTTYPSWKENKDRPFWMSQTDSKLKVEINNPKITPKAGTTAATLSSVESILRFGLKNNSYPYTLSL